MSPTNWKWIEINKVLKEYFSDHSTLVIDEATDEILNIAEQPMSQEEAQEYQDNI